MPSQATSLLRLALPPGVAVALRTAADSPALAREPVTPADLADIGAEVWLHCCLRRGFAGLPLAALPLQMLPRRQGNSRVERFDLEAVLPDGRRSRRSFTIHSLEHVARRGLQPLIDRGIIRHGSKCVYELSVDDESSMPLRPATAMPPAGAPVVPRAVPLEFVRRPLAPLLAEAREAGDPSPDDLPVFVTRSALGCALEAAARGIAAESPVEVGGVLKTSVS